MEDDEGFRRVCWRASIGLRQWPQLSMIEERRQLAQGLYNVYDFEQTDYPKDLYLPTTSKTPTLRSGSSNTNVPPTVARNVSTVFCTTFVPTSLNEYASGAVNSVSVAAAPVRTPANDTFIGTGAVLLYTAVLRMCEPVTLFVPATQ